MADRVDVLGAGSRLEPFTGDLLKRDLDADLQACVEAAARDTGAPIALVSLVLDRTQFFRAHHGLPADLAIARATDRDASFCQFVVRDGEAFEVQDCIADQRVPQDMVDRYGIRAYLGVPVVANDEIVGSLCVIDTVARSFSRKEKQTLAALGQRASERLQELADVPELALERLLEEGTAPAFAEIRNMIMPLLSGLEMSQRAVSELEPIGALLSSSLPEDELTRGLASLRRSAAGISHLQEYLGHMEEATSVLWRTIRALESVTATHAGSCPVSSVVETGLELAHHMTKLVGGVQASDLPVADVSCSLSTGAALLSTAASTLAGLTSRQSSPLALTGSIEGDEVVLILEAASALGSHRLTRAARRFNRFTLEDSSVRLAATERGFQLVFPRVTGT